MYHVSKKDMKKGYYKIVDDAGVTVRSGFHSKKVAEQIAREMTPVCAVCKKPVDEWSGIKDYATEIWYCKEHYPLKVW